MFRSIAAILLLATLVACEVSGSGDIFEGDAKTVQALREAGSDISKPHPIDFFFYGFVDRASAERFSQELNRPGWKFDAHQTPEASDWTVIASTVMVPDAREISDMRARFDALATKFGGEYDGWEAAVTK